MRITITYLILNIVARYGAIPLFITSTIVSLLALRYISITPILPDLGTMLAVGVLVCSFASALAASPATWRSGNRLFRSSGQHCRGCHPFPAHLPSRC